MNFGKLFGRETHRTETAEKDAALLAPKDVLSKEYIEGLNRTLGRIGVNVQKIEKL